MAEVKAYWKLFQQQNVLDGLRIFIDLSDEFLELLKKDGIISEKAFDRIKSYPWPASRTELIQTLVRMRWTQETFDKFYKAVVKTQDSQLCKLLTDRLPSGTAEHGTKSYSTNLYTGMDELLGPLSIESRVKVQTMLRDRDLEIINLRTDNERIREELRSATKQLSNETVQHKYLDTRLTDWLAGLPIDISSTADKLDETVLVESLKSVDQHIGNQSRRISQLESEQTELRSKIKALQNDVETLTEDRDRLLVAARAKPEKEVKQDERTKTAVVSGNHEDDVAILKPKMAFEIRSLPESAASSSNVGDFSPKAKKKTAIDGLKENKRKISLQISPKTLAGQLKAEHASHSCVRRNSLPKLSTQPHIGVSPKMRRKSRTPDCLPRPNAFDM